MNTFASIKALSDDELNQVRGGYYYINGGDIEPVYVYGKAGGGGGEGWDDQWNLFHEGNNGGEYDINHGAGSSGGQGSGQDNNGVVCIYVSGRPRSMSKQVGNFCVFFALEVVLKELNKGKILKGNDVNSLLNAFGKKFTYAIDGVSSSVIKNFIDGYLTVKGVDTSINCKNALANEHYVLATLKIGGVGNGHFVVITGYCDGYYEFLDPYTGGEGRAKDDSFFWDLSFEVLGLKGCKTENSSGTGSNYYYKR